VPLGAAAGIAQNWPGVHKAAVFCVFQLRFFEASSTPFLFRELSIVLAFKFSTSHRFRLF
jgi:hypothetical protein